MENRTIEKINVVSKTTDILEQPKSVEEILESFHDCRDCKNCLRMLTYWKCAKQKEKHFDYEHHYITNCEKFTLKEK